MNLLRSCLLVQTLAVPFWLRPTAIAAAAERSPLKFDFGPGEVAPGYTQVLPANIYTAATGYGFESNSPVAGLDRRQGDALHRDLCTSDRPFCFSVAVPEGNYLVTVVLGDPAAGSTNTVKAELRRLMLENIRTAPGEFATRKFVVNVRTPKIPGDGNVRLKERERTSEARAWDEKLTIEFNGFRPCVCALEIEPANELPTVFLLGDSTVCDQPREPWNSWGQMLPRFFKPDIAVANHAESGETLRSSLGAHRLDKVLAAMRPGDYLLVQYGHNDMKDKSTNALATYAANLRLFVQRTREKGGTPILVTSMERKAGRERPTLGDYPDTVRNVAKEERVALIDLNSMSKTLYIALGPERIDRAFQDGTHHNNYGSYELAKCVIQAIRTSHLPLADHIAADFGTFDPAHPDPVESFVMPPSPDASATKPLGD